MIHLPRKVPDELICSIGSTPWVHGSPGDPSLRIFPSEVSLSIFVLLIKWPSALREVTGGCRLFDAVLLLMLWDNEFVY